ncbi:hypothetical protein [Pseudomonas sp. Irchel 3E13]|uniref:hypothetical protein n=1 Tax=Pseudomonas sp. Irchel 3E13 TaxID=2008975 RepID=UPI000BA3965B|nr:hypothetical protein [Pseudomonas sp. Irchel 3E13]
MKEFQRYDKNYHLNNARSLIESGEIRSLRYACLELRMLIEAHVYQRLLAEIDELPKSIINTWQPSKAVRLHTQFDKYADMDFQLRLEGAGDTLEVNYNNIKSSDLIKIYNSLGSYLHLPMPKDIETFAIDKEKIIKWCDKLQRLTEGNLIILKINYITVDCMQCGKPIIYTDHYLKNQSKIACQNEQCEIEYSITNRDNSGVQLSADCNHFSCHVCKAQIPIPLKNITNGHRFNCLDCGTDFEFKLIVHSNTPRP